MGWEAQLARLAAYKAEHGDCNVPQGWPEDPKLGRWVSMQREGKRQLDRSEPSGGMTAARAAKLESLVFAWAPKVNRARAPQNSGRLQEESKEEEESEEEKEEEEEEVCDGRGQQSEKDA